MELRERTIYECEYCYKKRLMNKTSMKKHEDVCWYNPKNKTCIMCKYSNIEAWSYRSCCHPKYGNEIEFKDLKPRVGCLFWEELE